MKETAMALRDEMLTAFKDELTSGKGVLASPDFTINQAHFELARRKIFPSVSE